MGKGARIRRDRAGGTSSRANASANPPAILSSISEDIRILQNMGVDCDPILFSEHMLEDVTLHRLLAYVPFVRDNSPNGRMLIKALHDALTFDRRIQSDLLKYIGVFESRFRSIYSRALIAESGEFALYEESNFRRSENYRKTFKAYEREMARQSRNYAIRRHLTDSKKMVPVSVSVEYLPLGTLSKFYSNSASTNLADECASGFNLSASKMRSWIKTLTDVRNCCAHFNPYVVRKQIPSPPKPLGSAKELSQHPFFAFVMLEHMLSWTLDGKVKNANLNIPHRISEDVSRDVSQFMVLYEFSDKVADYLWIPERYRPRPAVQNGIAGHMVYSNEQIFFPDRESGYLP